MFYITYTYIHVYIHVIYVYMNLYIQTNIMYNAHIHTYHIRNYTNISLFNIPVNDEPNTAKKEETKDLRKIFYSELMFFKGLRNSCSYL